MLTDVSVGLSHFHTKDAKFQRAASVGVKGLFHSVIPVCWIEWLGLEFTQEPFKYVTDAKWDKHEPTIATRVAFNIENVCVQNKQSKVRMAHLI